MRPPFFCSCAFDRFCARIQKLLHKYMLWRFWQQYPVLISASAGWTVTVKWQPWQRKWDILVSFPFLFLHRVAGNSSSTCFLAFFRTIRIKHRVRDGKREEKSGGMQQISKAPVRACKRQLQISTLTLLCQLVRGRILILHFLEAAQCQCAGSFLDHSTNSFHTLELRYKLFEELKWNLRSIRLKRD